MGKKQMSGTRAHERENEGESENERERERERDGSEPPTAGITKNENKPYSKIFIGSYF